MYGVRRGAASSARRGHGWVSSLSLTPKGWFGPLSSPLLKGPPLLVLLGCVSV